MEPFYLVVYMERMKFHNQQGKVRMLHPYIFPKKLSVFHTLKKVVPLDLGPSHLAPSQNLKKSQAEASRDSAMRGVPLHVYYILFSQYTYPMGSGRPPWAAGEYSIGGGGGTGNYLKSTSENHCPPMHYTSTVGPMLKRDHPVFVQICKSKLYIRFKVTRHLCFKNSKNLRPQDILAFNSANIIQGALVNNLPKELA